jgi:hypothetical protein
MPNAIRLSVSPHSLALLRIRSGLLRRGQAASAAWHPLRPGGERAASWSAAVEALPDLLARAGVRGGRAEVVLSNHFVRYAVVPASEDLATQSEEAGYARARLAQIHGDVAEQWALRLSHEPAGCAHLAAAIDDGLVDALRLALKSRRVGLGSCRPALTAIMDAARTEIGDEAWVVVAEPERVLVASISRGQWVSVRALPAPGGTVVLRDVLAQERMLEAGAADGRKVYYSALGGVHVDAGGIVAQPLAAGGRVGLAPEARSQVTLAMAGLP